MYFPICEFWWMCCKFVKQKEVSMLWVSIWQLLLLEQFRSSHVYQMLGGFWHAHFHCCPRVALSSPLDMKSWSHEVNPCFKGKDFKPVTLICKRDSRQPFCLASAVKLGNFEAFHFVPNPDAIDFSRFPNCLMFQFGYTCSGLEGYVPRTEGKRSHKEDTTKPRNSQRVTLSEVKRRNRCKRSETVWSRFVLKSGSWIQPQFLLQRSLVLYGICLAKPLSWRVHRTDSPPSPERKIRQRGQDEKKQFALHICCVSLPDCQALRMPLPFQNSVPAILQVVAWSWQPSLWSGRVLKFGVIKIRWLDHVIFFSRDGQSIVTKSILIISALHFFVRRFLWRCHIWSRFCHFQCQQMAALWLDISHHIGGQLKIKDTDKGIILIMMRLMTMDNERRMIKLPLYYATTWCYISIWRTFTWLNVDIIHEADRFCSLRLSVGRWHRHVFGGWRNGADGGSATSGLRPGLRSWSKMCGFYELMWFESLEHIWKIWNKYTVLWMKG